MKLELKYGCNPHQAFAEARADGSSPVELLNGRPSMINLLDALNAWQLVRETREPQPRPAWWNVGDTPSSSQRFHTGS